MSPISDRASARARPARRSALHASRSREQHAAAGVPTSSRTRTRPPAPRRAPCRQEIAALTVQRERLQRGADAVGMKRGALVAQAASLKEVRLSGRRWMLALRPATLLGELA